MIRGFDSAVAGIRAFQTKLNTTSNNVANVNSDEFKKSRTEMTETAPQGVRAETRVVDTPGPQVVRETGNGVDTVELSNVNLAEEMTDMITAGHGVKANVASIRTQDEMIGTLLDMKR
jgi:flagellar basal-body rod protein FlgC